MNRLHQINSDNFAQFTEKLVAAQSHFLPMVFGTCKEAEKQTVGLSNFDGDYLFLLDELAPDYCLYALHRQGGALWFSLILPSDWDTRFEIFAASLPRLVDWFKMQQDYQYLYGKMEAPDTPPTLLEGYLPSFLHNRFKTEYRMWLQRSRELPLPPALALPAPFSRESFQDGLIDEVAGLVAEVFSSENVDFSFADAREEIAGLLGDELFRRSAMLIRDKAGQLIAVGWCMGAPESYPGEIVVRQDYQGRGLGRYLLNECIRSLASASPDQDIKMCTCREWTKAVRLYESYDFSPCDFWTYISFGKES